MCLAAFDTNLPQIMPPRSKECAQWRRPPFHGATMTMTLLILLLSMDRRPAFSVVVRPQRQRPPRDYRPPPSSLSVQYITNSMHTPLFLANGGTDDDDDDVGGSKEGTTATAAASSLGLTPELAKITNAFARIGDDQLRYKQLLYMANQLDDMDASLMVDENIVPGCLSTVHVHATLDQDHNLVYYVGTSDGLLTKGLVALLVRGLSGQTADAIQRVDPAFIHKAGIAASLTPGRNNGFLNMLAVMKQKAAVLAADYNNNNESQAVTSDNAPDTEASSSADNDDASQRPMYTAIAKALQDQLQPVQLELTDVSHQHAGHAEASGLDCESHFELFVVANAFADLNLIKRHQLVYRTLGDIMPQIHALQIQGTLTPDEAQQRST